jgi:hypothetical protein
MSGSYLLPLQLSPGTRAKAAILACPGASSFMLTVRTPATGTVGAEAGIGGSVYWERGTGTGGAPQWDGNARLCPPGTLTRDLACDAIRVWSSALDAPQFIQIEADV